MAVTKIWPIRASLTKPINYIINTDKTANPNFAIPTMSEESYQALEDVIEYAAQEDKTEQKYFVTGIGCNRRYARDEFIKAKKIAGKEGGIVAFHAYQSFKGQEVNPTEAHSIGIELAKEIWGGRFQVVVATHVNTDNVHNHFIVNSVSYKDGKRYHSCRETYALLRHTSDRICREHGLSVLESAKGKGISKYLYKLERAGMPTRYNVARQAIDEAISLSLTMDEFKSELRRRGYNFRFDPNRKYWTVTPPGYKKGIRTHQLGEDYTRESIERRIYENDPEVRVERYRDHHRRTYNYNLRRRIDLIMGRSGLEKLYLRYCYELGYLPKYKQNPTRLHTVLKDELLKCDMYSEQAKLLAKYHIGSEDELIGRMDALEEQINSLCADRNELRNKERRDIPSVEIVKANAEKKAVTSEIKMLRRELKICRQIEERSDHVRENLEKVDIDRQKERSKER